MGREGTDGSPTNCGNYQNHVDETIANNDRGLPDAAEFAALISGRRDRRSRERRDRRHYKYSPTRLPLLHLKSYLQKMVDRLALVLKMRDHVKHNVIVIFVVYGMVHLVMTLKLLHPNLNLLQKLAAAR